MKSYHKNPRQISAKQFGDLDQWLAEFGDLSGIVHDLNSDEIIGGNQRSRVFGVEGHELSELIRGSKIVITETFDEPTRSGTVALGFVFWGGEKYAYRQVRWTADQCERANIIANHSAGQWDWEILSSNFQPDVLMGLGFDQDNLTRWNFDAMNLREMMQSEDKINSQAEWEKAGMPEFQNDNILLRPVKIFFSTAEDKAAFAELIGKIITENTIFIWWPEPPPKENKNSTESGNA